MGELHLAFMPALSEAQEKACLSVTAVPFCPKYQSLLLFFVEQGGNFGHVSTVFHASQQGHGLFQSFSAHTCRSLDPESVFELVQSHHVIWMTQVSFHSLRVLRTAFGLDSYRNDGMVAFLEVFEALGHQQGLTGTRLNSSGHSQDFRISQPFFQQPFTTGSTLIEKILVHEATKDADGNCTQEIEIIYRFVGKID